MAEDAQGPFSVVDPKLTIYALANGLDLDKEAGLRRLAWYRDGRERGILLETDAEGSVQVTALAWTRGDSSSMQQARQGSPHTQQELADDLSTILDQAVVAAHDL